MVTALGYVREFAEHHGWTAHLQDPFFRGVELFQTQGALWQRILELNGISDIPMPTDGLTAALENQVLVAVVPEEAQRVRPEYFASNEDWIRVLAHEIVHRLHVRILGGNEEAMGPVWFFEGFAVMGSGQVFGDELEVESVDRALELAHSEGRGAYARYAAALRFFALQVPLAELVAHAGDADFEAWLIAAVGR